MELRLKQIKKQQQTIVQEMEYALKRRETIATRGAVQQRLNQDKTRSDVTKGITELKRQIRSLQQENAQIEETIRMHNEAQQEQVAEIEQLDLISRELNIKKTEIELALQNEEKLRNSSHSKLEKLQMKARMYRDTTGKTLIKKPEAFETTFQNLKNQQEQIKMIIEMLSDDFPHLSSNLNTIAEKYNLNE